MTNKINVGIIGAGAISHYHTQAYQKLPDVNIIAVCDINKERAQIYANKYGIEHVFNDYKKLLKLTELNAVSITTWNNLHAPITIAALKAGKAVLCEKPLALNTIEAQEMVKTAKDSNNLLMVGFVRRFGENTKLVKQSVEQGELGHIYYAKTGIIRRWGNPGGWFADKKRSGGGPVIDNGVHFIDLIRYLTGRPKAVSVTASTFHGVGMKPHIKGIDKYRSSDYSEYNDVEDGAVSIIKFDNGLTLFLETFWVLQAKEDRIYLNLFGDKSGIQMEPSVEFYEEKHNYLVQTKPEINTSKYSMEYIFTQEIKHFIDCIKNEATCISPGEDGLELMKIIDAIYKSADTGHEVVM